MRPLPLCLLRSLVIIYVVALLSGCASGRTDYIVWRDVPDTPSVTVLPDGWRDEGYTRRVEKMLVQLGIRVLNRPAPRRLERTETSETSGKGDAKTEAGGSEREARVKAEERRDSTSTTETYWDVVDLKSSHVIYVNDRNWTLKIVDIPSGQVLAVAEARPAGGWKGQPEIEAISDMMKAAGFKVREPLK